MKNFKKNHLLPLLGLTITANAVASGSEKPNVLFVLLDDLAYDAIESSNRYPFLKTPNISKLQRMGTTFSNYFCTMSLSSPSRACFLTGVYPHKHGVTQNHHKVEPDWKTYPPMSSYLQQAGYETALIGKIHMSARWGADQIRPGFDYWLSFRGQGDYFKNTFNENGVELEKAGYITDVLTDYAKEWLTLKRKDANKPFFLCLWHKAVHEPFFAAPRHKDCFSDELLPQPPHKNGCDTFENKPEWQRYKKTFYKIWDNDPQWNPNFEPPKAILETLLSVDDSMGEMMELLEKLGVAKNTLVIFTSDNGYLMGEHGFWDKRISYDECMRIPMIIYDPTTPNAPANVPQMCLNIDMMPTLLEYAGIPIPSHVQGRSMKPFLEKKKGVAWRDSFLFEYYVDDEYPYAGPSQLAVRTVRYKYVDALPVDQMDELYDLERDPGEMNNLINDSLHDDVVKQMQRELERLKIETGYTYDRDFWLRRELPKYNKQYHQKTNP